MDAPELNQGLSAQLRELLALASQARLPEVCNLRVAALRAEIELEGARYAEAAAALAATFKRLTALGMVLSEFDPTAKVEPFDGVPLFVPGFRHVQSLRAVTFHHPPFPLFDPARGLPPHSTWRDWLADEKATLAGLGFPLA